MRTDARCFAHECEVEVRDAAAARPHPLRRERKETVGRCAAPLRVGRRKMRPDVAVGERAEHRVRQRVEAHVGIGVTGEAVFVCDLHARQHHVVAGRESVDIESGAGADVGKRLGLFCLEARKIFRRRELEVARLAVEYRDLEACPFGKRRVVGEIIASRGQRSPMRLDQYGKCKRLGGLHHAQARAVERGFDHLPGRIEQLDRVGNRQDRNGGPRARGGCDSAGHQGGGRKRAGCVMNEYDVGPVPGQGFEAGPHRRLPGCAARYGRQKLEA